MSPHDDGAAALRRAKRRIAEYVNHIGDRAYIEKTWTVADMPVIDELLVSMLCSGDRERARQADLFVHDAVRFGPDPTFARYLPRSRSLRAVRDNLRSADYFTRHEAIHTLGRTGPRSNARHLESNFAWYLEHDPLNLEDLLAELFWLGHRVPIEHYLAQMAAADWYLTRWALVEVLWKGHRRRGHLPLDGSGSEYARSLLLRLAQDDHPSIRAEAQWRLSELEGNRSAQTLALATAEALDEPDPTFFNLMLNEPDPTFFNLMLNVSNFLTFSGRRDCDTDLVERVTVYLQEHPMPPGYDSAAYWRSFAARRVNDSRGRSVS